METIIEEQKLQKKNEIRVMVIGKLDNPKLECLRELYHH